MMDIICRIKVDGDGTTCELLRLRHSRAVELVPGNLLAINLALHSKLGHVILCVT